MVLFLHDEFSGALEIYWNTTCDYDQSFEHCHQSIKYPKKNKKTQSMALICDYVGNALALK